MICPPKLAPIRDELAGLGIQLMDTADGTDWYRTV